MLISLIAAVSQNGVIAHNGRMPWRQGDDLKYFKQKTIGHHVLMGRKTFESLGKYCPLPQRTNMILTNSLIFEAPAECIILHTLADALNTAEQQGETELFVIGGEQIYRLALPMADRLYITRIEANLAGDTFFPEINTNRQILWQQISSHSHPADNNNQYPYTFTIWHRKT